MDIGAIAKGSIILCSINTFIKKLNEGYSSSVIFKLINRCGRLVGSVYRNSATSRFMANVAAGIKKLAAGSYIWKFVKRDDFYTKIWEDSYVFKLVNKILNAPLFPCAKIYEKFADILSKSLFFGLLKLVLRRFDILIGVVVAFMLIVPHTLWFNGYGTLLAVMLAVLCFIKAVIRKQEIFNLKYLDFALLVFIVTIIMGEVTSYFPLKSLGFFIFYLTAFLFLIVIVSSVKTSSALNRMLEIILAGVSMTGIYGIWQKIKGVALDPALTDVNLNAGMPGRIFSTMQNPNSYAELLVLTIPFFFAIILNAKTFTKKAAYIVMLLPVLVSLLATGSRSSWIALVISVFIFVVLKNKKLVPLMILIGIMGFELLPYISETTYRRVLTLFMNDSSISYRGMILDTIKPMFRDFWFTGIGLDPDTFIEICKRYHLYTIYTVPPHTHNLFLQVWIEGGIISILAFVWFLVRLVKKSILIIARKGNAVIDHILIAGVSAVAGISVMGMAEYVWFYPRIMMVFWIVIAVVLASISIVAAKQEIFLEE